MSLRIRKAAIGSMSLCASSPASRVLSITMRSFLGVTALLFAALFTA